MDQQLARISTIEIFSQWTGFSDPPLHAAKLTIRASAGRFIREVAATGDNDELDAERVEQFFVALDRPMLPEPTPDALNAPCEVICQHFNSSWTDDYPSLLVRVAKRDGTRTTLRSESQFAFMLPLRFIDSATGTIRDTYDPELSRAIAALMPDNFLNRNRLAEYGGMFLFDLEQARSKQALETTPTGKISVVLESSEMPSSEPRPDGMQASECSLFGGEKSPTSTKATKQTTSPSPRISTRLSRRLRRDPNYVDEYGETALMRAAAAFGPKKWERFEQLVKAGADVEARRPDGMNGLQLACRNCTLEAVVAWVAAGANIEATTRQGATPLMLAATWDNIVELLLAHNAAVNAVDHNGHSALTYAVLGQSLVGAKRLLCSIRALLSAGADAALPDKQGLTPIDHARRSLARVELQHEVLQAFADSRTTEERHRQSAAIEQYEKEREQRRREHPEDEWLTKLDYDDHTLATEIVELLTAAAKDG